jgi:hypothetical protein
MAGAYCKFCGHRCFVGRVIPDGPMKGWRGHLATCQGGMAHDLKVTGHTHETAVNPATDPEAAAAIAATTVTDAVTWCEPVNLSKTGCTRRYMHALPHRDVNGREWGDGECVFCGQRIRLLGGEWTTDDGTIACTDTSAAFVPHKPKEA